MRSACYPTRARSQANPPAPLPSLANRQVFRVLACIGCSSCCHGWSQANPSPSHPPYRSETLLRETRLHRVLELLPRLVTRRELIEDDTEAAVGGWGGRFEECGWEGMCVGSGVGGWVG